MITERKSGEQGKKNASSAPGIVGAGIVGAGRLGKSLESKPARLLDSCHKAKAHAGRERFVRIPHDLVAQGVI